MSTTGRDTSYPRIRYLSDRGNQAARFRSVDTAPDLVAPSGDRTSFLATHASTDGQYGLYRVDMPSGSPGPAVHFHRTISESFFVMSGRVALFDGECWRTGRPGDFMFAPPGALHSFRNVADETSSMLMIFAPGAAGREQYFSEMTEMVLRGGDELREFRRWHDGFYPDKIDDESQNMR